MTGRVANSPKWYGRAGAAAAVALLLLGGYKLWSMWMSREPAWPPAVTRVDTLSNGDHTLQPAMFYAPPASSPASARPLLVALHTWGSGYDQADSIAYADWCIAHGWVFVHPHFRGANDQPAAMGSELVVADILGAVDYAKQHANVDPARIYLIGESGGGHAALLMAGRAPQRWAGVSAWAAPVDMIAFHAESRARGLRFAAQIERACGGEPLAGSTAAAECSKRSAHTYLPAARDVPIDLNAGIRDGHEGFGSVAIRHSLNAFNLLADPLDRFSAAEIEAMVRQALVPAPLTFTGTDPLYGASRVLLRRQSHHVRLTLFDGGHQRITEAGLAWLSALPARQTAVTN